MKTRRFVAMMILIAGTGWMPGFASEVPASTNLAASAPRIRPDYRDATIPPNIAPLNFVIEEPAQRHRVTISGSGSDSIQLQVGKSGAVRIPPGPWKSLLAASRGEDIRVAISSEVAPGSWRQSPTITNRVAREPVDGTLVYRFLKPLFNFYSELGIYQRDLESFRVTPILESRDLGTGCLNCHTFLNHDPQTFALHVRGQKGKAQPMMLVESNEVTRVDKTAGYISWHPSGQLIAFSANQLSLFFHTQGETRDVFDAESNLGVYWVSSNQVAMPPAISKPERLETWPMWAPDGRHLYFCSARKLRRERYRQVRYDLVRVSFDLERNVWGEPETMVAADDVGLSAAQPRVSPDGRWLVFCLAKYGHFPIYQPGSDLYVMDLATRQHRRLEINSDQADTWHCWSSNGRWLVFSSKRGNGLFARPHFSYVDEQGKFHTPFVLPQEDPNFYDACVQTFNVPELVRGAVTVGASALARGVLKPARVLKPEDAAQQEHHEEQNPVTPGR